MNVGPISLQISPSATRFKSISSPLQVQRPTGPVRGSGKGISSSNPLYVTPTPTLHCLLCEIPSCQLPPPHKLPKHIRDGLSGTPGGRKTYHQRETESPKGNSCPACHGEQEILVSTLSSNDTPAKAFWHQNACPFLTEDPQNPLCCWWRRRP